MQTVPGTSMPTGQNVFQTHSAGRLQSKTIDPIDVERILVTDSAGEAVQLAHDAALRQFGLSHGPKIKRRWFLGE